MRIIYKKPEDLFIKEYSHFQKISQQTKDQRKKLQQKRKQEEEESSEEEEEESDEESGEEIDEEEESEEEQKDQEQEEDLLDLDTEPIEKTQTDDKLTVDDFEDHFELEEEEFQQLWQDFDYE